MKDLKLIRKNIIANEANKFEFDVEGYEYLIKNLNDFDIYVSFEETTNTNKMKKIPAKCAEVCLINKDANLSDTSKELFASENVYVYATSAGEVEVQCLKF